jgi:hypothetical protein
MVVFSPLVTAMGTQKDTVIVQLSDDHAVITSTDVILEKNPGAKVVTYGTFEAYLTLASPINNLVIIGHGAEDGVLVQDDLTSWENYADIVDHMGAREKILLSCESVRAKEYLETDNVFTFTSAIDARMGGLVANMVISQKQPNSNFVGSIDELFTLNDDLASGKIAPINLYFDIGGGGGGTPTAYFSTTEKNYWLAKFAILGVSFLAGTFFLFNSAAQTAADKFMGDYGWMLWGFLVDIQTYGAKCMTDAAFQSKLWTFMCNTEKLGFYRYIKSEMNWYDWVLFGVSIVAAFALMFFTATGATWAIFVCKFLIFACKMVSYGISCKKDKLDSNGIVG